MRGAAEGRKGRRREGVALAAARRDRRHGGAARGARAQLAWRGDRRVRGLRRARALAHRICETPVSAAVSTGTPRCGTPTAAVLAPRATPAPPEGGVAELGVALGVAAAAARLAAAADGLPSAAQYGQDRHLQNLAGHQTRRPRRNGRLERAVRGRATALAVVGGLGRLAKGRARHKGQVTLERRLTLLLLGLLSRSRVAGHSVFGTLLLRLLALLGPAATRGGCCQRARRQILRKRNAAEGSRTAVVEVAGAEG